MRDLVDRLDRNTGSDPAHDGQFDGMHGLDRHGGAERRLLRGSATLDHAGGEPTAVPREAVGQLHDLNGAGAVREAADKAAFLKRRDQAVDAGFGAEVQRFLHLVERGRDAVALNPFVNEFQQVKLLLGQHGTTPSSGEYLALFYSCSRFVST